MRGLPLFEAQVKQADAFIRALRLLLTYVRGEMQVRHEAHEAVLELMHKGEMCHNCCTIDGPCGPNGDGGFEDDSPYNG